MKRNNINCKVIAIAILLVVLILFTSCNQNKDSSSETKEVEDSPVATLLFASDYQAEDGWNSPKENLRGILEAVETDKKNIDEVIICGDYTNDRELHDYQLSPEESINEIKNCVQEECSEVGVDDMLFVQGNHDQLTESISASGLHEFNDYLVYVINTENDFPWKQGKTEGSLEKVRKTSDDLKLCFDRLVDNSEDRPIIIAGHVPLHFSGRTSSLHTTGDNLYASIIFDVVNEYAKDLDIIYLFGHNHTKGWDCYLGQSCVYKEKGDTVIVPEYSEDTITSDTYTEKKLNFTYLNAGYIGHCMNCSPDEIYAGTVDEYEAADNTLTATVCEIYSNKIILTRYSSEGTHQLGSAGCASPYYDDSSLIPTKYYSENIDSPQIINRK